jgi:hypothetical protein
MATPKCVVETPSGEGYVGSSERTWEAEQLDAHPTIRDQVAASPEFRSWRDELRSFELDGERLYLPWGDVPMDEDQIIYQWASSHGLLAPGGEAGNER